MGWQLLNRKNFIKYSNPALLLLIIVTAFGFIYFPPQISPPAAPEKKVQLTGYTPSRPRLEITGLKYDLNFNGKRSISLKADRFLIRKRKLGLIRFGLAQEALFENAEVSFFNKKSISVPPEPIYGNLTTPLSLQEVSASEPAEDFSLLSMDEILTSSEAKRLSSIVLKPVIITFHDENNKISRIQADSASIQMQRQEFVLSGDVHVTAGEKHITTSRLIFLPEKNEIYIPGNFLLDIQGDKRTGKPVSSDVFLNSISL